MSAAEANTPPSPDIEFLNVYHCFFTCVVLFMFCQRAEDAPHPGQDGLAELITPPWPGKSFANPTPV